MYYYKALFIFACYLHYETTSKKKNMNIVIIDDEPFARQCIELIINENFTDINIVGQAGSVQKGVDVIKANKPDLVFLDVDLTDGSGFDILTKLKPITFKIIFITAYQKYALKAIKFSAFDYILKPISTDELIDAINRVDSDFGAENQKLKWNAFFNNISELNNETKKIVLKTNESIHLIKITDIIRCEADNNYSTFFLQNGEKIVISKGLKEFEDMLSGFGFFRVHQSHLINLNYILRFDKKDGGYIVLTNKSSVPVSQRKRQKLLDFFEGLA